MPLYRKSVFEIRHCNIPDACPFRLRWLGVAYDLQFYTMVVAIVSLQTSFDVSSGSAATILINVVIVDQHEARCVWSKNVFYCKPSPPAFKCLSSSKEPLPGPRLRLDVILVFAPALLLVMVEYKVVLYFAVYEER